MDLMKEQARVESIVIDAIKRCNDHLPDDTKIAIPESRDQNNSPLELDSLTLINLILKIEEVFFAETGQKLDLASDYVLSNAELHFASKHSLVQCIMAIVDDQDRQ